MKTEARKMAEKMSKSKKEEDIAELAREISRGGKPKGISSDIPAGIREQLVMKEREAMFKKGEENKYAKGGVVKKKVKKYAEGGMTIPSTRQDPANSVSPQEQQSRAQQAEMNKGAPTTPPQSRSNISNIRQQALLVNQKNQQRRQAMAAQPKTFGIPSQSNMSSQLQSPDKQVQLSGRPLTPQEMQQIQQLKEQNQGNLELAQQSYLQQLKGNTPQQQMMAKGGAVRKKKATGYAKGGVVKAMCGASVPPSQKGKK